jgi:hypothetical protein
MVYNAGIPIATDQIANSQAQLLENFAQLNTQFGIDHVKFDAASNNGHHSQVFLAAPISPVPTVTGTQGAIFSKDVAGVAQLFFANATTAQKALTGAFNAAAKGTAFLPGGIILKWGGTGIVSNGATVTFDSVFPTACWIVLLTIEDPGNPTKTINVQTGSKAVGQFKVNVSSGSISANFIAIGN